MPSVVDAQEAVAQIGKFTAAYAGLADKFQSFAKKNPEVMQGAMPAELQAIREKLGRLSAVHAALPGKIEALARHV